jgi:hypothetical protein
MTDIRCDMRSCVFNNQKGGCEAPEISMTILYTKDSVMSVCRVVKRKARKARSRRKARSKLV